MRTFSGLRRPLGGFLLDDPQAGARSDREAEKRFEQQAEAAKVFDDKFGHMVSQLNRRMEMMMRNMQEVLDLVSEQTTKIDSLNTLADGIRAEVQRLLANANVDQTTSQLVDQVFDKLKANSAALDAAIAENTSGTAPTETPPVSTEPAPAPEPIPAPAPEPVPTEDPKPAEPAPAQ